MSGEERRVGNIVEGRYMALSTFLSLDAVAKQESSYAQLHDQMMRVCVREDLSVLATREKGGAGRGRRRKEGRGKGKGERKNNKVTTIIVLQTKIKNIARIVTILGYSCIIGVFSQSTANSDYHNCIYAGSVSLYGTRSQTENDNMISEYTCILYHFPCWCVSIATILCPVRQLGGMSLSERMPAE